MRRVIWTEPAQHNVFAIKAYIRRASPMTAERLGERLTSAGESLAWFPDRGQRLRGGRWALTLVHPYQIVFRFDDENVFILRVRHGARKPLS